MQIVTDFIFLGSKTTVDNYCSHEIKRCLLLGRKAMTNLKVKVAQMCPTLCEPMGCIEYWRGWPFPSPGDLPNPGIEPRSRQHIKKPRYHFANKDPYRQSYGFSGSSVWM